MYFHWHFRECWLCWLCPQVTDKCSRYEYLKYFSNIVTANKTPIKIRIIPILIIIVISEISNISNLNNNNINNSIVKIKVKSNTKNYLKINWTEHHYCDQRNFLIGRKTWVIFAFHKKTVSRVCLNIAKHVSFMNNVRVMLNIVFFSHLMEICNLAYLLLGGRGNNYDIISYFNRL